MQPGDDVWVTNVGEIYVRHSCLKKKSLRFYAAAIDALSGQPRSYLAVGKQIKVNYSWAFSTTFADFKGK